MQPSPKPIMCNQFGKLDTLVGSVDGAKNILIVSLDKIEVTWV